MKNLKICIILALCTAIFLPKAVFCLSPETLTTKHAQEKPVILIAEDTFDVIILKKISEYLEQRAKKVPPKVLPKSPQTLGVLRVRRKDSPSSFIAIPITASPCSMAV